MKNNEAENFTLLLIFGSSTRNRSTFQSQIFPTKRIEVAKQENHLDLIKSIENQRCKKACLHWIPYIFQILERGDLSSHLGVYAYDCF